MYVESVNLNEQNQTEWNIFMVNKIWDLVPLRFSLSIYRYTVHVYLQLIFLLTFEPNNRDIILINIYKIHAQPQTLSIALRFNIISLNITIHLCIHVFRKPTAMHNKVRQIDSILNMYIYII